MCRKDLYTTQLCHFFGSVNSKHIQQVYKQQAYTGIRIGIVLRVTPVKHMSGFHDDTKVLI